MDSIQTQDIESVIRRYGEFIDGKAENEDVLAPNFRLFGPGMPPSGLEGREAYKAMLAGFAQAFPDLVHTLDTIAISGNVALTEWTGKGTHTGAFNGLPGTGNKIVMKTAAAYVVDGRQIVEERAYFNLGDLLSQIGAG